MTVSTLPVIPDDGNYSVELVQTPANPTGGRLVAWAEAAQAAGLLGKALAATSFVPKDFRGKPEECAAAILFGDEIGLSPAQAVQSVFVISGRPGLYARTMVAIVLAAGHDVETVAKTDAKVTVRGRRRGSQTWIEETWTTERARRAKYTSNAKYETDPQSMLYARAASDVCRQVAPDALAGIAYSVEELELAEPAPAVRVTRNQASTSGTVRRRAVEAPAPEPTEPPLEDATPTGSEADYYATQDGTVDLETGEIAEATVEPGPPVTKAQLTRLAILLKGAGLHDRGEGLAYLSGVVGRDVASSKDLTVAEASAVMDSLEADVAAAAEPGFEDGAA